MQVIENWADIRGRIRSLSQLGDLPGLVTALIDVEGVTPVPGFANLLENASGDILRINIPQAAVERFGLHQGQVVVCRARKGGPHTIFAHPDLFTAEKS
jgi:hypothetical protein